jgi:glycosyltransferase involved in cell wall biosynthesis
MAMEVPVVATNVGSVSEVVRDGETGLLAPPLNPEALAAGIVSVLQRADLGRELASAGRRLIEERYRLDAMLDRLDALYDDLVRGRGVAESTMREARGW